MSTTRRLFSNLVSLTTGEMTSRIVGFLAFAVLARRLHTDEYGAVEFAVALAAFFAMVVDFGLETIGARSIAANRDQARRLAAQIPAARLLLAILAVPVMGSVAIITGQPASTVELVWLFGIALFALPWFQRWLFQGLEMMHSVSIGQVIRSAVFCAGVFIFVRQPGDLQAVGLVEIAAALAATLFYLAVQRRRGVAPPGFDPSPVAMRDLYRQSSSVGLSQIVWAGNQYLPTLMVAALAAASELSWLGASQRIVFSAIAFSWVYHFNLFPTLTRFLKESRPAFESLVGASYRSIAWLGIMAALTGALFASEISRVVFGEPFAAAAGPLAIMVWAIPITLLSGHARITLIAGDEQRFVLVSQLTGVATTLVVGLLTIPRYGATGGAATIVISYLAVWGAAHFFAVRRVAWVPLMDVLPPLLASVAVLALREHYAPSSLMAGAAALGIYILSAPLLDRKLLADIGRLMAARRDKSVSA